MTSKEDIQKFLLNKKDNELLDLFEKDKEKTIKLVLEIAKEHADWKIRRDATRILGKAEIKEAMPLLQDILLTDHLTIMRKTAAKAMSCIGDPTAIPHLLNALQTSKDPSIVVDVACALGNLKATEAVDTLISMLQKSIDGIALGLQQLIDILLVYLVTPANLADSIIKSQPSGVPGICYHSRYRIAGRNRKVSLIYYLFNCLRLVRIKKAFSLRSEVIAR